MMTASQNLHGAHELICAPIQLEREVRHVANDQDADRLQQAIAICWITAVTSAQYIDHDPLALEDGVLELEAAYDRIDYVRASARVGERHARALEQLAYCGYAEIEPLWPDDAARLADDLRQRGYDAEITSSECNAWDVHCLAQVIAKKTEDGE